MKTIKEYFDKAFGNYIDFDGKFGTQCVDLTRDYVKFIECQQSLPVVGAYQLRFPDFYEVTDPNAGDIIIVNKSSSNPYGHTAIILFASNENIVVLQQDGFNQNLPAHVKVLPKNDNIRYYRKRN